MRKLLAILFLTIFSFQVLPVRAIGKLLTSGQNTEEVHNEDSGPEDGPGGKVAKFGDDVLMLHQDHSDLLASRQVFDTKVAAFIHLSESLPSVHIAAMPSPPPDGVSMSI